MLNAVTNYFKQIGAKRIIIMIIGNVFLGMGISIFKLSSLGNDPYSGMIMALSDCVNVSYTSLLIIVNISLFVIQLIVGRNYIGAGTFVNALLLGYIVTFFYDIWIKMSLVPELFWQKIIVVCIGVIICGLGISLYQSPNLGASPYDSLSLILAERQSKVKYFWYRMATDALCALICFLAGGIVGLGTLVSALGFGPVINFFNVHISDKILNLKNKV